ncbi:MAG: transcription termination factor NusA [Patescibacteria group bacterium]
MELDLKQLGLVIRSIATEKNLSEDAVKEVVEQALAAAYRRDFGERDQEVRVSLNLNTGDMDVVTVKTVVEEIEDSAIEMTLEDAKKTNPKAKVGDEIEIPGQVENFGRVAAQTAKQVIMQRLREAEREIVMNEYQDKIGTVVNAIIGRVEGRMVRVELDKAQAIMPPSEQIQGERYHPGQRLKVYIKDIERGGRGPQLLVSRACPEFIEWLFRGEVPEMESGAVSIKAIAREAGIRTKLAVTSSVPGVDAVGTFVGGHGTRVNAVMSEIGDGEKIDIIVWDEGTEQFIKNALSPTETVAVIVDEANKKAVVRVAEDQLSIAIGKGGQNVRLASKLSGYEIDIVSDSAEPTVPKDAEVTTSKPLGGQKLKRKDQLEAGLLSAIEEHGEETEDSKEEPKA